MKRTHSGSGDDISVAVIFDPELLAGKREMLLDQIHQNQEEKRIREEAALSERRRRAEELERARKAEEERQRRLEMEELEEEAGEDNDAPDDIAFCDVDVDLQAPTGRIGETKKTALSTAVDKSPIVKAKQSEPETDPRKVWIEIKSRVYEHDRHLGQVLASSRLAMLGNGAYISLNSDDPYEARELGSSQGFKLVSQEIKYRIPGINHVFSCTQKQYENVEKKYAADNPGSEVNPIVFDDSSSDPASDFINSLGAAGLNTEIHFGDN
jgi:hypothetical protein